MITKLTAENAELYYAPRFAQVTKALQAAGKNIEIKSLEDYFYHLTDIANLENRHEIPGSYLLIIPADEDIFEINANTRVITVPATVKKNGIGVYGDHRAEMIIFRIDRYFDVQDLAETKISINWSFTPANAKTPLKSDYMEGFAPTDEIDDGKILFGFVITKDMTPSKGTLTFAISFYTEDAGNITYALNTLTASVNINDTITLINPNEVKSDSANFIGRLTNSVYVDDNISAVEIPSWKSGPVLAADDPVSGLKAGAKAGLYSSAYLAANEDITNVYENGIKLSAIASAVPATASVNYKWSFSPENGNIDMGRQPSIVDVAGDYILLDADQFPASDPEDGSVFYLQNASLGTPETDNPLTWSDAKALLDEDENARFYMLGSNFVAHVAGKYQVSAQAQIGVAQYEKVLPTAELKADVNYYIKDENDNIDTENPLVNADATAAKAQGKELYILAAAGRNSAVLKSAVLTMPAAVQPSVSLTAITPFVWEGSDFPKVAANDPNVVLESGDDSFVYISDTDKPTIVATVSVDSEEPLDDDGAFAVELIPVDAPALDLATINNKIANEELVFTALPANGQFSFEANEVADNQSYVVRAINRRNGTYSVSEPSNLITTSFVAPAITELTVRTRPESGEGVVVLDNGEKAGENGEAKVLQISRDGVREYTFEIIDNSTNRNGAEVSYIVEEVKRDGEDIIPLTPEDNDLVSPDVYEIVFDSDNIPTFTIRDDGGEFRIKTVNRYNNTATTAYTDIFAIEARL